MTVQRSIEFNTSLAKEKRDKGIKKAAESARKIDPEWIEKAYSLLKEYATIHGVFQVEDVRYFSQGKIVSPPSSRSWGAVVRKAAHEGIIEHTGRIQSVKNVNAHRANAAVWRSRILK